MHGASPQEARLDLSVLSAMAMMRSSERSGTSRFSLQMSSTCASSRACTPRLGRGSSLSPSSPAFRYRRTQVRMVSASTLTGSPSGPVHVLSASCLRVASRWPRGGSRAR